MTSRIPISNNFMFGRVLCREDICRGFLERVLGTEVGSIAYLNREQVLQPTVASRGVRLDVYAETALGVIDVEMQANPHADLGRRLRYYQASIDSGLLDQGSSWRDLRDSYIIFACDFDWLGAGFPVYTFDRLCRENSALSAQTGSTWVVLNACAGAIAPNEGLRNLLEYIRKGAVAPDDELISAMDAAVSAANEDREWVGSVMTVGDLLDDARADAIAEGLAEGRAEGRVEGIARMAALAAKLAEDGRAEDALAVMADPVAAEELLRKYGL